MSNCSIILRAASRLACGASALPRSPLQRFDVQMRLRQQLLELGVLSLRLAQPRGFASLHAAELGTPLVERRIAEPVLPAQLLDCHARLGLPQEPDDLLVGEPALLHVRSFLGKRTLLTLIRYAGWGAGHKPWQNANDESFNGMLRLWPAGHRRSYVPRRTMSRCEFAA